MCVYIYIYICIHIYIYIYIYIYITYTVPSGRAGRAPAHDHARAQSWPHGWPQPW